MSSTCTKFVFRVNRKTKIAALPIISIETVKVASSKHRFYFDIHKVCGNLGGVKCTGWVVNTYFLCEFGLDMSTSTLVWDK